MTLLIESNESQIKYCALCTFLADLEPGKVMNELLTEDVNFIITQTSIAILVRFPK